MNAAVAEALEDFKARVDALIAKGEDQTSAIIDIVREDIKTCKPIRFDGNGYSDEWKEEASETWLGLRGILPGSLRPLSGQGEHRDVCQDQRDERERVEGASEE